jgi:uncharacterized protein (DUF1800 family)
MVQKQLMNQHLLWRAGFGPAASQLNQLSALEPSQLYNQLKANSSKTPNYLHITDNYLQGLIMGVGDVVKMEELQKKGLDAETRKKFRDKSREDIKLLNLHWLREMVHTKAQLREKMSFFWHGHFACRDINVFHQQLLLHDIRENALENFGDLLKAVSKSPAMLGFLNNQQNRKGNPNENFAREVMELFTLGRGSYTEKDVKEAARAFTGWGFNLKGEFVFRPFQHDKGSKTFLNHTGNYTGDDILNILLEQKQTALFITKKIYRFFVNEKLDDEKIIWLSDRFYQNSYNIGALMDDIFNSKWFYEQQHIGSRIKSPIELIAGLNRMLPMEMKNKESLLLLQRLLGQVLFYPPNVAGWPGGKSWIDSSSLMTRMRIPLLLIDADELNIAPKTDDDQQMGQATNNRMQKLLMADIDWNSYTRQFEHIERKNLLNQIQQTLLQTKVAYPQSLIQHFSDDSGRESFIKTATIKMMSTPEYQMA